MSNIKLKNILAENMRRFGTKNLSEQAIINLAKASPNFSRGVGRLGKPEDGIDVDLGDTSDCKVKKPMEDIIKEIFSKLKGITSPTITYDVKKYIFRLKDSMEGLGSSDDVYNVFKEVKDKETMASIIKNWESVTKSNESLYEWISDEMTVRWVVLYSIIQKNNYYDVKFDPCVTRKQIGG